MEIFPGANRTSLMLVTNHKPGSLYQVLARFNAMGINIIKLESRPIPSTDFEFMFYFDIDESVYSENFIRMINQLSQTCREFIYLGSYIEL
jgi:chorismate mutase/prephenate dehydratase